MDYYTWLRNVDLGILGHREADIEYQVIDGKPELLGVWLYGLPGINHAIDVLNLVIDKAYDAIIDGIMVDHQSRVNDEAEYRMER